MYECIGTIKNSKGKIKNFALKDQNRHIVFVSAEKVKILLKQCSLRINHLDLDNYDRVIYRNKVRTV
jgi:hypothetical protein